MKYAFFEGCNIPIRIQQYSRAMAAVVEQFGITLEKIDDFNCCGYPVRNVDETAYILPSMRNMAIAESRNQDIFVICNCCFASLQKAKNILATNTDLKNELNLILAKEGLQYTGKVLIKHFLEVLYLDIGLENIRGKLSNKFTELNVSVIQGCHILRPREITLFDDSFAPRITDELLQVVGVNSLDWQGKLECCGAALAGINSELSTTLLQEKITGARAAGANYIVPICSYCYLQFDTAQLELSKKEDSQNILPVLLYPQLLGLCLGISPEILGLSENNTIGAPHIEELVSLLGPPVEEKKKRRKKAVSA
jgi:heterodisulfide reductase subunit B